MNVEIGTEAAHFPEKEYICGIFTAVRVTLLSYGLQCKFPTRFSYGFFWILKYQNPFSPGKMRYSLSDSSILFYSVDVDPPLYSVMYCTVYKYKNTAFRTSDYSMSNCPCHTLFYKIKRYGIPYCTSVHCTTFSYFKEYVNESSITVSQCTLLPSFCTQGSMVKTREKAWVY
jgi:hypothetical protein